MGSKAAQRIYNNEMWTMNITFHRDGKTYQLPAQYIGELVIEESMLHWPVKGYLTYNDPYFDSIEKGNFWNYRMDGKDGLSISTSITDIPKDSQARGRTDADNVPEQLWQINHNFVIYDIDDIPHSAATTKTRKVYFWDRRYQQMLDTNVEWSTATTEFNEECKDEENLSQKTDEQRSLKTGIAINALLTDTGFGGVAHDEGVSNIFHTSPTKNTIDDDLNYMLDRHISPTTIMLPTTADDVTEPVFYTSRETGNSFELKALNWFFIYPNFPNQTYENVYLEDFSGKEGNPIASRKSPPIGITVGQFSTIYRYEFIDTTGINNTNALNNKPVYWYDNGKGQFGTDFVAHECKNIKDAFTSQFCDIRWKRVPIFTLNSEKLAHYNIDSRFTFSDGTSNYFGSKISRYPMGRNEVLQSGVFLNECLSVRMAGLPFRTRGMFMSVDRTPGTSNTDNNLDSRLLGPWWLIKVQHIWKHDMYVNDVICAKINSYEGLGISDGY